MVQASLFAAHMPTSFWGEAITTATYLINRVPSSSLHFQTPYHVLHTAIVAPTVPNLSPRIFECVAFVHLHKPLRDKLEPRALRCVFVGYAAHQKGYRCYHPPTKKMYITLDVVFHEDTMYYSRVPSLQGESKCELKPTVDDVFLSPETAGLPTYLPENLPLPETLPGHPENLPETLPGLPDNFPKFTQPAAPTDTAPQVPASPTQVLVNQLFSPIESTSDSHVRLEPLFKVLPDRATRGVPKVQYDPVLKSIAKYPMSNFLSYHRLSKAYASFVDQLSVVPIPNNVQEASKDSRWVAAMNEEMQSLQKNSTWEVVDLPEGKKPVRCRWVYTIKHKADGSIERFKARLVAKGYTQSYGIDYTETFAPVAKINTVRVLLSLTVNLDWPLHQFDVNNAFLHGELQEEVYMELPPGCKVKIEGSKQMCKLRKSLYGLKQSPRAWFGRFTNSMKVFGYKQSNSDHTLFLKHTKVGITALIVYVDDMIVTGNDPKERKALQAHLSQEFEMKDLGLLKYFLGIEVSRSKKGIFLSQRKYSLDLLSETGMSACSPVSTPLEENVKLSMYSDQAPANKERYQRLVG